MNKHEIPHSIRKHPLVATIRAAVQENNCIIGVSGGVDSVALLLLSAAAAMQTSASFTIKVAHIHHGLRSASDEEQLFVEQLCNRLCVQCISKRIDVEPIDGSIAAGARNARYAALASIANTENVNTVLVAHHASDQLETILMALCRGGGIKQIAGMSPRRILKHGVSLVRPLLQTNKEMLIEICTSCAVQWCEDPTNQDCSTPRGKLRTEILPLLRDLYPAADRHAANAAQLLQESILATAIEIPNGTSWERKSLSQHPHAMIAEAMHQVLGTHATFETVQSIATAVKDDNTNPRTFTCSQGSVAVVTAHRVEVIYS